MMASNHPLPTTAASMDVPAKPHAPAGPSGPQPRLSSTLNILDLLLGIGVVMLGVVAASFAARSAPQIVSRVAQALLSRGGLKGLGRAVPLLAAPLSAHLNNRDIERAGEAAMRFYGTIRQLPRRVREEPA